MNAPPDGSQRQYWNFYWPLLLWSLSMVVARQLQNAALASFDPAGSEIAIFAYATSVYWLPQAMLAFVPQVANVLGRSPRSRRICLIFTGSICLLLTLPLIFAGFTPVGRQVLSWALGIRETSTLDQVGSYLQWLWPMIVNASRWVSLTTLRSAVARPATKRAATTKTAVLRGIIISSDTAFELIVRAS